MTRKQLGNRFSKPITEQAIKKFEDCEPLGKITIKTLCKIANALNMEVYYRFLPNSNYKNVDAKILKIRYSKWEMIPSLRPIETTEKPLGSLMKECRLSANLTMKDLGMKLGISAQAVADLEKSEAEGTITLKSLEKFAKAVEMNFVYCFSPYHETIGKWLLEKVRMHVLELYKAEKDNLSANSDYKTKLKYTKSNKDQSAKKDLRIKFYKEIPKEIWD